MLRKPIIHDISPMIYNLSALFGSIGFLLMTAILLTGCTSPQTTQLVEYADSGITLEKFKNWDEALVERSGMVVLWSKTGIWQKNQVRIEVQGPACTPKHLTNYIDAEDELDSNIDRIGNLYGIKSVSIIQEPIIIKAGEFEILKAIIQIPTIAMDEDKARIQVGDSGPNISQTINVYAITDKNHNTLMAFVYEGNDKKLNSEAETIIKSIKIICTNDS